MSDDNDLPSYDDATSVSQPSYLPKQARAQRDVHSQLSRLGEQISLARSRRVEDLYHQDQQALDTLIPCISSFLEDYSKTGLTKAKLVMIPASKISQDATPADDDLTAEGEYFRVEQVSGEPRILQFWEDGDIARRLAVYLQPGNDVNAREVRQPTGVPLPAPNSTKRSFWKTSPSKTSSSTPAVLSLQGNDQKNSSNDPVVAMDVKAEEVAFRTQTPFGLYGTESGWGIVIRISVSFK